MKKLIILIFISIFAISAVGCAKKDEQKPHEPESEKGASFIWGGANLYFLLTDRFNNGNSVNDVNYDRKEETAYLRGFEGGDIKGIINKIDSGYFEELGINAIWLTPIFEQGYGSVDEGTGISYGYHGYWTKDWTSLDANFGTKDELRELVEKAHKKEIRIVLDAVINHTGPVTESDVVWPDNWVRTRPKCDFETYETTVNCTLVDNLPDIRTESNENINLPDHLIKKWKNEGRYEIEMQELDAFFERTGYPRAPRFYIIKWLTDYILEFGIDAYRADTVKHIEETVWKEFKIECDYAFALWKKNNPTLVLDNTDFFLFGEVYNFVISSAKAFDFGDKKVNYYDYGFNAMINFEFKSDAKGDYQSIFSKYSEILNFGIQNGTVLNYLTSHDDSSPFDRDRLKPLESATKLLLSPGISQVYYGDELARPINIEDATGDASLRSVMNWADYENDDETKIIFDHWMKLGQFRKNHPAVGAGRHKLISEKPYTFSRVLKTEFVSDNVVIALDLPLGKKELEVSSIFENGQTLIDKYSNTEVTVKDGLVSVESDFDIVLLELK